MYFGLQYILTDSTTPLHGVPRWTILFLILKSDRLKPVGF